MTTRLLVQVPLGRIKAREAESERMLSDLSTRYQSVDTDPAPLADSGPDQDKGDSR